MAPKPSDNRLDKRLGPEVGHVVGARLQEGDEIGEPLLSSLSGAQLIAFRVALHARGLELRGYRVRRMRRSGELSHK